MPSLKVVRFPIIRLLSLANFTALLLLSIVRKFILQCYLVFNWFAVLRMKLSKRLNACVLDRPCSQSGCGHRHKSVEWWVVLVNSGFVLLNLFHLAYLGVMFDVTNEEPGLQEQVCISLFTMSEQSSSFNYISYI